MSYITVCVHVTGQYLKLDKLIEIKYTVLQNSRKYILNIHIAIHSNSKDGARKTNMAYPSGIIVPKGYV